MKDIFKKYNKHKKISNISIVATSLVLAVGINLFIIDGSDYSNSLKANILESKTLSQQADIYATLNNDTIEVSAGENMKNVKNISLSLAYNHQNVNIVSKSSQNSEIIELNESGNFSTLFLNYTTAKNISQNEVLFQIEAQKKEDKSENINIINANFTDDSGETYELSTSGITF